MAQPTTAVLFSGSDPAAPPGLQNTIPQSDGGQPAQLVSQYMPLAIPGDGGAAGSVKPDGISITQDLDGTIHSVATAGGGGTGGGVGAAGLVLTPVHPSGARDGSNTQFTLPAPPVANTFGIAFLNGVQLEALGASAQYAVQGTQFTMALPPQSTDVLTYYYYQGTPNSESGGGGSVIPVVVTGIAAWAMNEGSGLIFYDSAAGDNATLNGGGAVAWQANSGFPGVTPLWSGSGYALAAGSSATDFDGTTAFSIVVWMRTSSTAAETFLGTLNASGGSYQGWEIEKDGHTGLGSGALKFFLINNYPSNSIEIIFVQGSGPAPIDDGALHCLIVTYDGSRAAAGVVGYLDGVLQTNDAENDSLTASSASGLPIRFGARNDGTNEFSGDMAYVEIFNGVMGSTQVAAIVARGPALN